MKEIRTALTAESAELEALVQSALPPQAGIACAPRFAERTPDAAVFIGASPRFFERNRDAIRSASRGGSRVLCVGPACAAACLPETADCETVLLPVRRDARSLELFRKTLLIRVKSAGAPRGTAPPDETARRPSGRLVGIGASTGGPQALLSILRGLPKSTCAILVVQHLSAGFSARFAEYLDPLCAMRVRQAENGAPAEDGVIYLAEDGRHLSVARGPDGYLLQSAAGEKVSGFCPSANRLFESLAGQAGRFAMGVVLTGMGDDGARGLRLLREAGGCTVVQEEKSCVAPSMPREAARLCAAAEQLPPERIAARIARFSDAPFDPPARRAE